MTWTSRRAGQSDIHEARRDSETRALAHRPREAVRWGDEHCLLADERRFMAPLFLLGSPPRVTLCPNLRARGDDRGACPRARLRRSGAWVQRHSLDERPDPARGF